MTLLYNNWNERCKETTPLIADDVYAVVQKARALTHCGACTAS